MFRAPKRLGLLWQCCTLDQRPRCAHTVPSCNAVLQLNVSFLMKKLHSLLVLLPVLLATGGFVPGVRAASVGTSGYTNAFSVQPPTADWSTFSIGGGAGTLTTA